MRQLRYNHATNVIRLDFPAEWVGEDISGVTLTINDRNGDELLAAQALTLYTATTLAAATERFVSSAVLASGATALTPGDAVSIDGIEGAERQVVKGYDSTTRTVELEGLLENEHALGDAVTGLWGTYTLDTTTVATWTKGIVVTLIWTPTGSGQAITEAAQISASALEVAGLEQSFSTLYPRAYDALKKPVDRFSAMTMEAKRQMNNELIGRGMDINRIVDDDDIAPALMAKIAFLWTLDGDIEKQDEREFLSNNYETQFGFLISNPIWTDSNQDTIEDEGEVTDHPYLPERGW